MKKKLLLAPIAASAILSIPAIASAADIVITDVQKHSRQPIEMGHCRNDGGQCTVEAGKSATAEINGEIGVDFKGLNASLGGGYSETFTDSQGCSKDLKPGERLVMYPSGDFVFFEKGNKKATAFLPTGIECITERDW